METLKRKSDAKEVKQYYKLVAPLYDIWSCLTERKALQRVLKLAEIKDGESILEVACGTGWLFREVVRQNPKGKNIAVDLSEDMINITRKKLASVNTKNYELLEGDIWTLDMKEQQFDLIINNFMVDLLPEENFLNVASLFHNLLKPNGRLVVSTFSFGNKKYHKFWYWLARTFPQLLTGCRPVNFKPYLKEIGFELKRHEIISQNTFPSEVLLAIKPPQD